MLVDFVQVEGDVPLGGIADVVAVQARDQQPLTVTVPFVGFDTAYSKLR